MITNGKELKAWRKENHLTQRELATEIEYSPGRISHIEAHNESLSQGLSFRLSILDEHINPPSRKMLDEALENMNNLPNKDIGQVFDLEESLARLLDSMSQDKINNHMWFVARSLDALRSIVEADSSSLKDTATMKLKEIYRGASILQKR